MHPFATQVLGKRLGAAVKEVSAGIRALTSEQVLAAQQAGFVEVARQRLDVSELKVRGSRAHKRPGHGFLPLCSLALRGAWGPCST